MREQTRGNGENEGGTTIIGNGWLGGGGVSAKNLEGAQPSRKGDGGGVTKQVTKTKPRGIHEVRKTKFVGGYK